MKGIMKLDVAIVTVDSYTRRISKTVIECSQRTLNKIIEEEGIESFMDENHYKGFHEIIINNNLEFGKCIVKSEKKIEELEDIEISILD